MSNSLIVNLTLRDILMPGIGRNYYRPTLLKIVLSFLILFGFTTNVMADDETFQNRPNLMWLSSDTSVSVFGDSEYDSFIGKGEFWANNWGVTANLLQNTNNDVFGLPKDSEYINLDIKRRFGNADTYNFELGLGWQELSIDSYLEASGPKLSLTGRMSVLDSLQVYGLTSYFPELEDELQNNDATAYEFEAGVLYQPYPSVSFKAGYRHFSLDLENDPILEELGSSKGFLLGTDWSW